MKPNTFLNSVMVLFLLSFQSLLALADDTAPSTLCPTLNGTFFEANLRTGRAFGPDYLLQVNSRGLLLTDLRGNIILSLQRGVPVESRTPDEIKTLVYDCRAGGFYLSLRKHFVDGYDNNTLLEVYPTYHRNNIWLMENRQTASNPAGVITGQDFGIRELVQTSTAQKAGLANSATWLESFSR